MEMEDELQNFFDRFPFNVKTFTVTIMQGCARKSSIMMVNALLELRTFQSQ